MTHSAMTISAMYAVGDDNLMSDQEWPIPTPLAHKLAILDAVKWSATPLDINIFTIPQDETSGLTYGEIFFHGSSNTDGTGTSPFIEAIQARLAEIGWFVVNQKDVAQNIFVVEIIH